MAYVLFMNDRCTDAHIHKQRTETDNDGNDGHQAKIGSIKIVCEYD